MTRPRPRYTTPQYVPYVGFTDPVAGGTVSLFSDWGTQAQLERLADLYWEIAVTHWLAVAEIHQMAQLAIHDAQALEDDFNWMREIEDCIYQAKRDAQRLRKLRQQGGGSLDELEAILQRNREGLEQLMRIDPARAEEIRT